MQPEHDDNYFRLYAKTIRFSYTNRCNNLAKIPRTALHKGTERKNCIDTLHLILGHINY